MLHTLSDVVVAGRTRTSRKLLRGAAELIDGSVRSPNVTDGLAGDRSGDDLDACMSFGATAGPRQTSRRELRQLYPRAGWVEHDPEDIWRDTVETMRHIVEAEGDEILAIGITNQRETTVVWDRDTGTPIYNAIVWQDRRTAGYCADLKNHGCERFVRERTGLLLDPYFSATKLKWILDTVPEARSRAARGRLAFGTIDSFLLWRLTGGQVHATDASNAARTLPYNIYDGCWDTDMLALFGIPDGLLPEVRDNAALFGATEKGLFGHPIPVGGMAGDQQAAMVGQACFAPGDAKATYGTGCFLLLNTGDEPVTSNNGLITTVAYRIAGKTTYALEGSIFVAGAAVKWLRDGLGLINHVAETSAMAAELEDNHGVYMVPGFVGLGAPHWDPAARATITGLTFDATGAHIARAALEAVAYQTADLIDAMIADGAREPGTIRVDGGMASNDWLCQFLADMLDTEVQRPANIETTAAGAACLAGLTMGVWTKLEDVSASWEGDRRFEPGMNAGIRAGHKSSWSDALARTRSSIL